MALMTKVVAALDETGAAGPVARAAVDLGALVAAEVEAVHVATGTGSHGAATAASHFGLPLSILKGEVVAELAAAGAADDVEALVVGTRRIPGGTYPVGHVPLELAARLQVPILVVAPDSTVSTSELVGSSTASLDKADHGARIGAKPKVVIALDASASADQVLKKVVERMAARGAEIVALHVFNEYSTPKFWDQQSHADNPWTEEFVARHLGVPGIRLELRSGSPASRIVEMATAEGAIMIVLASSGRIDAGHSEVAREVLSRSSVPVLLVPKAYTEASALDGT